MIELRDLHFRYRKQTPLLDGLHVQFDTGLVHAVLGHNGVGKSTLFQIISGLIRGYQGQVSVNGFDPLARQPQFLSSLFFVPESALETKLSANQYANIYGVFYPKFSAQGFQAALNALEVEADRPMHQQSFGQRKKMMLSYALSIGADYLLLDEPTNGLDISSKAVFRKLLVEYIEPERNVILATHNVRELEDVIDHLTILDNGKVALHRNVHELAEQLTITSSREAPQHEQLIFSEKVHGGHKALIATPNNGQSLLDLEMVYKAARQAPQKFQLEGESA